MTIDDDLDAAILATLRTAPGQSMWWAELREQFSAAGYWPWPRTGA